jgi:hypothetical protein
MSLLVEYSNQDKQKEENEKVYTAYDKLLRDTTQGECCCGTLGALCCCGI